MLKFFEDSEGFIIALLVLLGLGGVAYLLYKQYAGDAGDSAGQKSSLLGGLIGEDSVDPATGASNGIINSVDNAIFHNANPGGGEVAGTSETYTGALLTSISHPIDTLGSIFGIGD